MLKGNSDLNNMEVVIWHYQKNGQEKLNII